MRWGSTDLTGCPVGTRLDSALRQQRIICRPRCRSRRGAYEEVARIRKPAQSARKSQNCMQTYLRFLSHAYASSPSPRRSPPALLLLALPRPLPSPRPFARATTSLSLAPSPSRTRHLSSRRRMLGAALTDHRGLPWRRLLALPARLPRTLRRR